MMEEFLRGAKDGGAEVRELFARDLKIGPCIACDRCIELGRCFQRDDYDLVDEEMDKAGIVALATPVHFYSVSTHAKILMDRVQAQWNQKYVVKDEKYVSRPERTGVLIALGATKGAQLFDGLRLSVKYFFDAVNIKIKHEILVRGVDNKGDIMDHPDLLRQAYNLGKSLSQPDDSRARTSS